ncbi:hypothetical protein EDEG_00768 [Edhazardia aedis USNM 41457]|uniref:50S ribosomal protein L31e n=1 Tax=Edhazardia aedis (strain USNM 41457) TaxID=1003232 RepID=J9DV43_EDHAE|nr:hypothetical protein EDEG_00768 [Edhazardia aedis USNM 41457]|eukprot:EJW05157.1 hypothetical protein EDEG_00768 [Edhazardia aedis USNM 41457]
MSTEQQIGKTIEMTVNLKKVTRGVSWTNKAPHAVRNIKRMIHKIYNTKDPVLIAPELNKAIWGRGKFHVPNKVRVRVEKFAGSKGPVFKVSLVIVGSFKSLLTQAVTD